MLSEECPTLTYVLPTYVLVLNSIEKVIKTAKDLKDKQVEDAFTAGQIKLQKYWQKTDDSLSYSIAVSMFQEFKVFFYY